MFVSYTRPGLNRPSQNLNCSGNFFGAGGDFGAPDFALLGGRALPAVADFTGGIEVAMGRGIAVAAGAGGMASLGAVDMGGAVAVGAGIAGSLETGSICAF